MKQLVQTVWRDCGPSVVCLVSRRGEAAGPGHDRVMQKILLVSALVMTLGLSGCDPRPQPLRYSAPWSCAITWANGSTPLARTVSPFDD